MSGGRNRGLAIICSVANGFPFGVARFPSDPRRRCRFAGPLGLTVQTMTAFLRDDRAALQDRCRSASRKPLPGTRRGSCPRYKSSRFRSRANAPGMVCDELRARGPHGSPANLKELLTGIVP
jgi:hypothetical protein